MGFQKSIILLSLFGFFFLEVSGQVGIGTTTPSASSSLDIESTDSGVLMPRVILTSTAVFAPISTTPEESLLVYNTNTVNDVTPGYYYWKNARWNRINDNSDKVYGDLSNSDQTYSYTSMQNVNLLEPIWFEVVGEIQGVTTIPYSIPPPKNFRPSVQGFEIITSGIYRVSYSVSIEMYHASAAQSAVTVDFYLTTSTQLNPTNVTDLNNNSIPGSYARGRVVDDGHASYSMSKIIHLDAGDYVRLFNNKSYAIVYIMPDSATLNIELIEAD
jgi:hypothetical protein